MDKNLYEKLGFRKNPFFQEPVDIEIHGLDAFVDRQNFKRFVNRIQMFGEGKYIVFSDVGEGKSSAINYAKWFFKKQNMDVVYSKLEDIRDERDFYVSLLESISSSKSAEKHQKEILDALKYEKIFEEEIEKEIRKEKSLAGKLSAALFGVERGISEAEKKGKVIRKRELTKSKLLKCVLSILKQLDGVVLLIDDLDKFDDEDLKDIITYFIESIPSKILTIVTGDEEFLTVDNMKLLRRVFDDIILLSPIESGPRLREFVEGRMIKYSASSDVGKAFSGSVYDILYDRTNGNLRRTFCYCQKAIFDCKNKITEKDILEVIKEIDKIEFSTISDDHMLILKEFAGKEFTVDDLSELNILSRTALRKIIELRQLNLVFKIKAGKKGRGHATIYRIPRIIKEII